jgi:integrase
MAQFEVSDIKRWVAARKPIAKAVGDGTGLALTISRAGTAAWVLRYRVGPRGRELTLGRWPDIGLRHAQELAREARNKLNKGTDPAAEKQAGRAAAAIGRPTFKSVALDWHAKEIESAYTNPGKVLRTVELYALPLLGALPADEVRPRQISHVLDEAAKTAPTAANDLVRYLKRIFSYARRREIVDMNPAADFGPKDAGGKEEPRARALTAAELRQLFEAMKTHRATFGRDNELAVRLLLMLGVRKMELLAAKWVEFDLDANVWMLPAEPSRNKTRQPIAIPLPTAARPLLAELKVRAAESAFVFPARRVSAKARFPHVGPDTLNVALKDLPHGIAEDFSVHDLRRTTRTLLAALRVPREIAERVLNHKLKGVEGTYNVWDYFDERAEAMDKLCAHLAAIESGEVIK